MNLKSLVFTAVGSFLLATSGQAAGEAVFLYEVKGVSQSFSISDRVEVAVRSVSSEDMKIQIRLEDEQGKPLPWSKPMTLVRHEEKSEAGVKLVYSFTAENQLTYSVITEITQEDAREGGAVNQVSRFEIIAINERNLRQTNLFSGEMVLKAMNATIGN